MLLCENGHIFRLLRIKSYILCKYSDAIDLYKKRTVTDLLSIRLGDIRQRSTTTSESDIYFCLSMVFGVRRVLC